MKVTFLLLIVGLAALVSVLALRRRRERRRAERARALRAERAKARKRPAPYVSANLRGAAPPGPGNPPPAAPMQHPPSRAA